MRHVHRPITSYATNTHSTYSPSGGSPCVMCKTDKHPLYACHKFKGLNHADKVAIVKTNSLCFNCLKSGHSSRSCKSLYHCKVCNKSHHSLLHVNEFKPNSEPALEQSTPSKGPEIIGLKSGAAME